MALIGAALIDPSTLDRTRVDAADFRHPLATACWAAALALRTARKPIDTVTIESALPEAISSLSRAFLADCTLATPTARNADHYADIVSSDALHRRVKLALSELLADADEMTGPSMLASAQNVVRGLDVKGADDGSDLADLVRQRYDAYGEMAERRERGDVTVTGIPTGLEKLDEVIGGIQQGIVTVVAGMSSMGKSSVALGFAAHAMSLGLGVHVFTMEDTRAVYADRMVARVSGVPVTSIRSGKLSKGDMEGMLTASRVLTAKRGWTVDDSASLSPDEVCRRVRRRIDAQKTKLVIVDYLQLMRHPKAARHDLQIAASMNVLAALAKQDDLAVVALSQLNRGNKERRDKRPAEQDLRGAGEIGEASKCVIGVYRGSHLGDPIKGIDYDQTRPSEHEWQQRIELHVIKNSNGPTGVVRCRWSGETTRVY